MSWSCGHLHACPNDWGKKVRLDRVSKESRGFFELTYLCFNQLRLGPSQLIVQSHLRQYQLGQSHLSNK